MTTHEVLVAARNILDLRGWIQGDYEHDGAYCALGAVKVAAGADPHILEQDPSVKEYCDAIKAFVPLMEVNVWNDVPTRTKSQVLALFDRAIEATAPEPDTSFLTEPEKAVA